MVLPSGESCASCKNLRRNKSAGSTVRNSFFSFIRFSFYAPFTLRPFQESLYFRFVKDPCNRANLTLPPDHLFQHRVGNSSRLYFHQTFVYYIKCAIQFFFRDDERGLDSKYRSTEGDKEDPFLVASPADL